MRYDEYIKILDELKSTAENRVIAIIPNFKDFAFEAIIDWFDNSLSSQSGKLIASEETIDALNNFDSFYLKALSKMSGYELAVSDMLKDLPRLSSTIEAFQTTTNDINWENANIGASEKLIVNEILQAYLGNGMNANFIQPLREQLYRNIAAGTNVTEAKEGLKEFIKGGKDKSGKLEQYLTQTGQQAVDSYTGMINKKLMESFNYPLLIMSGSLIVTSSPQCIMGIKDFDGIIRKEDFEKKIKPIAKKNGLIKKTEWNDIPFNKFHWACRHEFTPALTIPVR